MKTFATCPRVEPSGPVILQSLWRWLLFCAAIFQCVHARAQLIPIAAGATNPMGLTASEPFHRSGRILKPNGEPAIGALVRVAGAKDQQTTEMQTGAGGKFEVEWTRTSATQPYMLAVRDVADNLGAMEDLDAADDPMEIKLEPALDLVVRTESGHAPVTNADLLLSCRVGNSSVWMPGLSLKTNKPGQYEIPGLVPGKPYGLVVSAPGFGRRSFYQLPPSPAGQEMLPVELESADQIVAGQVVDWPALRSPTSKCAFRAFQVLSRCR